MLFCDVGGEREWRLRLPSISPTITSPLMVLGLAASAASSSNVDARTQNAPRLGSWDLDAFNDVIADLTTPGQYIPYFWPIAVISVVLAFTIAAVVPSFSERPSPTQKENEQSRTKVAQAQKLFMGKLMEGARSFDPHESDPSLLKKFSSYQSYTTKHATYPSIRTFHRPHPQIHKLPSKPTVLPLLVFVHGLGGSLAQFAAILTSLIDVAPCFGIDLPGCGCSDFAPTNWSAYEPNALTELIQVAIEKHISPDQGFILVGHSLGCSLSAAVALLNLSSPEEDTPEVLGFIGVCPAAEPPSGRKAMVLKALLCIPGPIFDLWRAWDRRGGPYSQSVARYVGSEAGIEVKKLQERFNAQSRTPVYRRMAWGLLPHRRDSSGMAGLGTWAKLKLPVFLIGGDADAVTNVDQVDRISCALGRQNSAGSCQSNTDGVISDMGGNGHPETENDTVRTTNAKSVTETTMLNAGRVSATSTELIDTSPKYTSRRQVLKTSILPAPASHALLYDPATSRTLSGLIQPFLYEHVDTRLSLGWQLQYLSTDGKWDVKNLAKWLKVQPVSGPIKGIFRAMKTLREVDNAHSPEHFAKQWERKITAIIDVSHETPVYDPKGLDTRGIEYHKFPTVSKIPPTVEETREFARLVDQLRASKSEDGADALIGVHCHYGFNRTGFFICSYLIEREGLGVQTAIDEFAAQRPPGIRHPHFLDELFVRYCVGLKRAPTM